MLPERFFPVRDQRANTRRRQTQHIDAMTFDNLPDTAGRRIVGRTFVEQDGRAVRVGADQLPRAHDPSHVGKPEQQLAGMQIGLVGGLFGDLDQQPKLKEKLFKEFPLAIDGDGYLLFDLIPER